MKIYLIYIIILNYMTLTEKVYMKILKINIIKKNLIYFLIISTNFQIDIIITKKKLIYIKNYVII